MAKIVTKASNILFNMKAFKKLVAKKFENNADRNMSANITFLTPPQEKTINLIISLIEAEGSN